MAVAAAALSTDSVPKSPVERLPVAETLEEAARKLEAYVQKLKAHAAEIRAEAAVEKMWIPEELTKALGENVKTATCISPDKSREFLGSAGFEYSYSHKPGKMPSSFVKTSDGSAPALLVRCAPVKPDLYTMQHAKIVIVFQRFHDPKHATAWLEAGSVITNREYEQRLSSYSSGYYLDLKHLRSDDFQRFADLVAGKDVTDPQGTIWRRI